MHTKLKKRLRTQFITSLLTSIGFVAGIPLIVFGAVGGKYILMALGIALVLYGFFGTPLFWVAYGETKGLSRVVLAVTEEHLYTVNAIAAHLSLPHGRVKSHLMTAIHKRYLVGFIFRDDQLFPNEQPDLAPKPPKPVYRQLRCENCGASIEIDDGNLFCTYCGAQLHKE